MVVNGITSESAASRPAVLARRAVAARLQRRGIATETGDEGTGDRAVSFRVPPGESGSANLRAPTAASAMLRLIAFERGHLASHAREAVARGETVQRQWIDIKVGVAHGGEVVPVGGSAETVVEPTGPGGRGALGEVVRELAYAGELGRIFAAPGSAYLPFPRRLFPRVIANADTVLNVLQIERDIRELGARLPEGILKVYRSTAPDVLRAKLSELAVVEDALSGLRDALVPLRSPEAFVPVPEAASADFGTAVELVRALVESYNATVTALNRSLRPGAGSLSGEGVVARSREAVVGGINAPVAETAERTDEATDVGLERRFTGKITFREEALSAALRQLGDFFRPSATVTADGVPSVGSSLGELGIVADGNDTLRLDEGVLRRALAERPEQVAELFSRVGVRDDAADSGLAVRTGDYLARVLRPGSGGFAVRRTVLGALIEQRPGQRYADALRDVLHVGTLSLLA